MINDATKGREKRQEKESRKMRPRFQRTRDDAINGIRRHPQTFYLIHYANAAVPRPGAVDCRAGAGLAMMHRPARSPPALEGAARVTPVRTALHFALVDVDACTVTVSFIDRDGEEEEARSRNMVHEALTSDRRRDRQRSRGSLD
jgi:hypothetical protein